VSTLVELINASLTQIDLSEIEVVKAKHCVSFSELIDIYKEDLTVTQSFKDCLAICLAVHMAVKLEGEPLWLYLVGAPSSGKSTICELLSADEHHTRPLSKFTGLVSGSRQGQHLIPYLQNKCMVIKDGTLLLESTPQQLANVYGELRDIFDGSLEARYRNGVSASFNNISFGMIIGITERVYSLNMAALGERFLHCRLETTRETETERNETAIRRILSGCKLSVAEGNDEGDSRSFPKQRQYTAGFINHLHSRLSNEDIIRPSFTSEDCTLIQSLADVIACSRANAPRKHDREEISYNSRPEASTRLVKLYSKLALCLCYVLGVNKITPEVRRLMCKCTVDTAHGRQFDILRSITLSQQGMNKQAVAVATSVPLETLNRKIEDLKSLGVLVQSKEEERKVQGRRNHVLVTPTWVTNSFRRTFKAIRENKQEA
jgi:hypothetical protein